MLYSLSVKNFDNDDEQIVGKHKPHWNLLTSSPLFVDQASDLSHLSGDEERYNWKLTFNFCIYLDAKEIFVLISSSSEILFN